MSNVKTRHLVFILLIAGCSSTRQVAFESEPPGAVVRVSGEEYVTPCVVELADEKTTVEMMLSPEQVMLVEVPEGYGFWDLTGEAAGTAGAYALYGISAPFIVAGIVGEAALACGSDFSVGDPYVGLVVVASAISGRVVGELLAVTGESLEESSDLKEHFVLVVFPVASSTPNSSIDVDESGSSIVPTPADVRATLTPPPSMAEMSLLY